MEKTMVREEAVEVMEAKTAETEIEEEAKLKKRKINGGELSFSSSQVQLKHRRRIVFEEENSISPLTSENSNNPLYSPSSDHALPSCYSSNASTQPPKENSEIIDLQEEETGSVEIATSATCNVESMERRKTSPSREFPAEYSGELESATVFRPSEANSGHRSTAVKMMPSDAELEDFFSAAERDLQKKFAEKYNFDIVKEEALEGRYEWIRVKP